MELLRVISVPGLSARMLTDGAGLRLRAMRAATIVVLDGASAAQLEAALVTGLLPEFHNRPGVLPLWHDIPARVETEFPLPQGWRAWGRKELRLDWQTRTLKLDALEAEAAGQGPLAVLSCRAGERDGHPLDRPVLLTRGITQTRDCLGLLEVAGVLRRALTGEVLTDEA
jgi:hypothetical protein